MDIDEYLNNPCNMASIPYWKVQSMRIPNGMCIVHDDDYNETKWYNYIDELYFRLLHSLKDLKKPILPCGYSLHHAELNEYVQHIHRCYGDIDLSEQELQTYTMRTVYDPSLWVAIIKNDTGEIAATGIAELDKDIGEGVLEWIQVSEDHRRRGLGTYIVSELLFRMKNSAKFATVSGKCNDSSCPEMLYRKCGFTGSDIWHILRLKSEDTI